MIKKLPSVLSSNGFLVAVWQDTETKLYNVTYDSKKPETCIYADKQVMYKNKGLVEVADVYINSVVTHA